MRTSEAFVIGATVGVVVGWLWGRDRVGERTRRVRTKALTAHWYVIYAAGLMASTML